MLRGALGAFQIRGRRNNSLHDEPTCEERLYYLCVLACLPGLGFAADRETSEKAADRAEAYYNFAMGHLYAELAMDFGNRGEYLASAIDHYKQAIKADPGATFLTEELAGLYIQAGQAE